MNNEAISTLVLDGKKQDMTVLFINPREIKKEGLDQFFKIIVDNIHEYKGICQKQDDNILALFNTRIKQFRHDLAAVKAALAIQKEFKILKAIKVGLGIHIGQAIVNNSKNIVRYTVIGNIVTMARKLAVQADTNEILISKQIHDRISQDIKTEKAQEIQEIFRVKGVTLREKYGPQINKIISRIKQEEREMKEKQKKS